MTGSFIYCPRNSELPRELPRSFIYCPRNSELPSLVETASLAEVKLDLFDKLSDLFGTAEIDLVILNTAPISLAGRILQKKQLLVDKEPFRRHRYESLTLREFFDFRIKEEA
jgi:hypothetical protein